MTSCQICRIKRESHYYTFQNSTVSFNDAKSKCSELGGALAFNLNSRVYVKFKKCCSTRKQYWIGLVDNGNCRSPKKPYQWIGSTQCRNPRPLKIPRPPRFRSGCYVVTVILSRTNKKIPQAIRSSCNSEHAFICRLPWSGGSVVSTTASSISLSLAVVNSYTHMASTANSLNTPTAISTISASTTDASTSTAYTTATPLMTSTSTDVVSTPAVFSTDSSTSNLPNTGAIKIKTSIFIERKTNVFTKSPLESNKTASISLKSTKPSFSLFSTSQSKITTGLLKPRPNFYSTDKGFFTENFTEASSIGSSSAKPLNVIGSNPDSAIIGGILGSMVILLLGILICMSCRRNKKRKPSRIGFNFLFVPSETSKNFGNSNTRSG